MGRIRKHIQTIHREVDGVLGQIFGGSPNIKTLSKAKSLSIDPDNFSMFTYSKMDHFQNFHVMPLYNNQTPATCDLKVYQDLFVYTFILDNIPKGAKILEVGGGDSRVISCLKNDYEFWNLDKFEGQGHGPKTIMESEGYQLIKDYLGALSSKLPDHYFDLVYSISSVEHFSTDEKIMDDIILDYQRLLKENAICLNCVDALIFDDYLWIHPIITKIKSKIEGVITETGIEKIKADKELWTIPKYAYYTRWFPITRKWISAFGRPFSANILWQNILQ